MGRLVGKEQTPQKGWNWLIPPSSTAYTWDLFGQLAKVKAQGDIAYTWTARYDGLGRRLETCLGGTKTCFYYDPEVLFLELGQTHQMGKTHTLWKLYGPNFSGQYAGNQGWGALEGVQHDGEFHSIITNGLGDVAAYTSPYEPDLVPYIHKDEDGNWAFRSRASCSHDGSLDTYMGSILWQGIAEDPTGLVLVGTRYYDPVFQRFISPDPLGHEGSWDLYSYANGDPINYRDPTGAFACKAYEVTKPYAPAAISLAVDLSPFSTLKKGKAVVEVITGSDIITGEKVSRVMALTNVIPGGSSLGALNKATKAKAAAKVEQKAAQTIQKTVSKAPSVPKIHGNSLDYVGPTHTYKVLKPRKGIGLIVFLSKIKPKRLLQIQ